MFSLSCGQQVQNEGLVSGRLVDEAGACREQVEGVQGRWELGKPVGEEEMEPCSMGKDSARSTDRRILRPEAEPGAFLSVFDCRTTRVPPVRYSSLANYTNRLKKKKKKKYFSLSEILSNAPTYISLQTQVIWNLSDLLGVGFGALDKVGLQGRAYRPLQTGPSLPLSCVHKHSFNLVHLWSTSILHIE